MEHDMYAPPTAVVADVPAMAEQAGGDFHVVGKTKFFTMYLATFGLYIVVWMYQHWAQFKHRRKVPMWPVARGLFPVFFTHSLTEEIDHNLKRAGIAHAWSPSGLATVIVVLLIASNLMDRLLASFMPETTLLGLTLGSVILLAFLLWRVQVAANLACGEPDAASNSRFGVANWIFAILGGAWWALILIGLSLPADTAA